MRRAALLVGCAALASCFREETIAPSGPRDRTYVLRAPSTETGPHPVVMFLHAYETDARTQEAYFHLKRALKNAGFAVALPHGRYNKGGALYWNATPSCCDFDGAAPDDVRYLIGVLEDVSRRVEVDPRRVYLMGVSNGGFMAERLLCERPDLIAGAVSVSSGGLTDADCPTLRPGTRYLHVHGDSDELVSLDGGAFPPLRPWPAGRVSLERFSAAGGCQGWEQSAAGFDVDSVVAGAETDVATAVGCDAGAVESWTVRGGRHHIPLTKGAATRMLEFLDGPARANTSPASQ